MKLEERIKEAGLKKSWIAKQLDLSEPGLRLKRIGRSKWRKRELRELARILRIEAETLSAEIGPENIKQ